MKIAAWNLNHRVGKTRYLPEAASAIGSLTVDVLVLTEYFPRVHDKQFASDLMDHGFSSLVASKETDEDANRVLIAAKERFEIDSLALPTFDQQFPANVLAVRFPSTNIRLLGVRVPYYIDKELPRVQDAWAWLETAAETLKEDKAIIVGDLNASVTSSSSRGGDHFRRIMESGWVRAQPANGSSFFGKDGVNTEIDHALCTATLRLVSVRYETKTVNEVFVGGDKALSDHAVLMVEVLPD